MKTGQRIVIREEQYGKVYGRFIPKVFAVETFLGCNLKCPECAIGADIITRQKGGMSFKQFKIIADKIRPFCEYLYLHLWGEPLLNKDIFKMVEYASKFTRTNISTHGNCLTEEKAEELILSGVTDILVSIDGFSQEVYEQYRKGGSVDKALWSLKKLQELNIRYDNKVTIHPQFIVFEHNQHEMELFGEFCHSIGLKAIYKAPYIRSNSRYRNCNDPKYVRPSYRDSSSLKQAMRDCKNPKEVFTILLDGTCVMCCYDHNGITNYGNIYEQEVLDIWNSPRYRKDRLDIIEGMAPEYCIEKCLHWTLHQAAAEYTNDHIGSSIEEHSLAVKDYGRRQKPHYDVSDCQRALKQARESFENGDFNEAFDIYEQLSIAQPSQAIEILAEVYDRYQLLPNRSRYSLYQSRSYNFGIKPTDKVLDIGSGHIPLPFATHLADISIEDNDYGRAGAPFKYIDGKSVYECNVERLPFGDKEFDFVYCSHVLEHVDNPEKACSELMRIAKRGYIETPTKAKDLWLNSAKVSNHKWAVEKENGVLVFSEYSTEELGGLECGVLMEMHCRPETKREKGFSALIYLKAELFNTMLLWEGSFEYRVRRSARQPDCLGTQVHSGNKILIPETRKIDKHSRIQVIGTEYGSCAVVLDIIPPGSTVISAGVGEDISFDRELIRLKNCKIIGIDPTEKARRYIESNPNENFYFQQKALYCEGNKRVKIYKNTNPDYVSESIAPSHNMVSASESYEAETISIPELLNEYPDVSLLKLDIEGAEYEVLTSMSKPDIPQIYVEFHHFCTDFTRDETIRCIKHLNEIGYVIVYGVNQGGALKDVTFVHHKYINEEDIVQMNLEEMQAVKC